MDSNSNRIIYRTIAYALNAVLVTETVRLLLFTLGFPEQLIIQLSTLVRNVGYGLVFFISCRFFFKKCTIKTISLILFFFIEAIVTVFLIQQDLSAFYITLSILFFRCIPVYILCRFTTDCNLLVHEMKPYVLLAFFYGSAKFFGIGFNKADYMVFSYALLVPTLVCIYYGFENKKLFSFIAAWLFMVVLVRGARGAALCVMIGFISCIPFVYPKLVSGKLFAFISLIVLILLGFANLDFILQWLYNIFPDSRTLSIFSNLTMEQQFEGSGRTFIYKSVLSLLDDYFLTGTGVFLNRYHLSVLLGYSTIESGIYEHNFILEILLQFGVVIGFLVMACLLKFFIQGVVHANKHSRSSVIFLMLILSSTMTHLFVSGSYIEDVCFWALIGLLGSSVAKNCETKAVKY